MFEQKFESLGGLTPVVEQFCAQSPEQLRVFPLNYRSTKISP